MSIHEVIKQVVSIILAHAKPEQIWLYGSRTAGEATETSDIDIAYDDKECKEQWQIEEDIEMLEGMYMAQVTVGFKLKLCKPDPVLLSYSS